jgi:hypothetical protein
MKKRAEVILFAFLSLTLFCGNLYASPDSFSVAVKAGTLGGGVEVISEIKPHVNFRIGGNAFNYDYTDTEEDIEYDFDLNLRSVSAIFDWHPFKGGFKFSAGVLSNGNDLDMKAKSTATYTIGGTDYPGDQVGTLSGEVGFQSVAPYLGFGWGNAFGRDKRVGVVFDVGVLFQGMPKVDLSVDGTLADNEDFLANLAIEEQDLKEELEEFKYYPVISLGMTYSF